LEAGQCKRAQIDQSGLVSASMFGSVQADLVSASEVGSV
jgi:hypothetical protein